MGYTQPFSFLLSPNDKIIGIHTNIRVKDRSYTNKIRKLNIIKKSFELKAMFILKSRIFIPKGFYCRSFLIIF